MHPNCRCSIAAYMDPDSFNKWLDWVEAGKPEGGPEAYSANANTNIRQNAQPLSRNYVNKDDLLYKNLQSVKPYKDFEDFGSHGTADAVIVETNNGQEARYNAQEYADILRADPEYHGGKVRLLSCKAGASKNGFAQQLADELQVDIMAPTETLWVGEKGELFISDSEVLADLWYNHGKIDKSINATGEATGEWKIFHPREGN